MIINYVWREDDGWGETIDYVLRTDCENEDEAERLLHDADCIRCLGIAAFDGNLEKDDYETYRPKWFKLPYEEFLEDCSDDFVEIVEGTFMFHKYNLEILGTEAVKIYRN